jgi:hypothetical protein
LRRPARGGIFGRINEVTQILSAIEQGDPHAAEHAAWPAGQRRKLRKLPLL